MKRLDLIANFAVIITSVALLAFLGNFWWMSHHPNTLPPAKALAGSTVHLSSVDFAQQKKTLLIVISPTCHFCVASEPFYRQLASMQGLKTHLVAVVPVPQADAERFVHSSINSSLEVVSASLDDVHVEATPTLLLVDAYGKVEKAWVGQLDDSGQKQVQSQL